MVLTAQKTLARDRLIRQVQGMAKDPDVPQPVPHELRMVKRWQASF
ncbi:hypothetical protein ART_0507 [Arthrobacter sp. PAMC 25486]|nr:hypothetical protein [Arthrobacter sp. PAMC 25486]AIY00106.1 hypothetical protein ART_0507 [Arthrobacter sp. PAMC 25486]